MSFFARPMATAGEAVMNYLRNSLGTLLWTLVLFLFAALSVQKSSPSVTAAPAQKPDNAKEALVARGRYLVEELARCADCHTPRDSSGALDRSAWLRGAPVWIMPVRTKEAWAMRAPSLAGLPYSDQQAQDILERGIGTNGNAIQPPMHAYHLHHEDAISIIAYLRSLSHAR